MITSGLIASAFPGNKNALARVSAWKELSTELLLTPYQQAAFIAQCAHETGNFRWSREIWGPTETQKRYEGRKDLGNTQPGDGKRYLGRGDIQITGRFNYQTLSDDTGVDFVTNPQMLESPMYAVMGAAWYWKKHSLNKWCDLKDFDGLSDTINRGRKTIKIGDANGYADRLSIFNRLLTLMGEKNVS